MSGWLGGAGAGVRLRGLQLLKDSATGVSRIVRSPSARMLMNGLTHRIWIGSVTPTVESVALALSEGATALGPAPRPGERWVVKLNLTYPTYLAGAVNSPAFVEGLCRYAADCGISLTFLEGDGGNGSYTAQDAFDGNGVTGIAAKYGMRCASVSRDPWEWRETEVAGRTIRLPYSPFFQRKEWDRFVTAPLFKNHMITTVTLGMKNLWGCIPDAFRMYYHSVLDLGIVALYKELRPDVSIFDGLIAMRGRGPMEGSPIEMNALLIASNVGAGERAALDIMGIPLKKVRHLAIAEREGLLPPATALTWLRDPAPFRRSDFILERTALNHLSLWLARSPRLQRVVYHSPLSRPIYAIVNTLRGDSAQTRLFAAHKAGLYGVTNAPPPGDSRRSVK
jgi:uncharacterized protein (DUF362 family)